MKNLILIIGSLIAVISGIITLSFFFQQSLQMDIAERFNMEQFLLSESIADDIKSYVLREQEELLLTARILSEDNIGSERDFAKIEGKLKTAHKGMVDAKLGLINTRGELLFFRGDRNLLRSDIPNIIQKAKGMEFGMTRLLEKPSFLYIISPVYRWSGPAHIAFFRIRIDALSNIAQNFVSSIKSGTIRYAWMMDKNGTLLFHPKQPGMVGRNLYKADTTCFKCHLNFNLEKKIVEGRVDSVGKYIAPSGEDKIVAFSTIPIDNLSWIVAVSSPYSEVSLPIKHSMKLYSYLIVSMFITISFVSAVLIVLNKKRINAQAVARRKEELEKYAAQLEDRVNERTAELSSEKEKLNTIVSTIGGGIILVSKEGQIQWANQMMGDMAGTDVIGKYCSELFQECNQAAAYSHDHIDTIILTNLFDRKDNYFQVTTAPLLGDDGELHGYIRLIQDVTEVKKMEEQIINSEKLASIGRLAAGIAHEIGNPLTSIFSFVQILGEMEKEDTFKRESLETISFHVNRITEILKQLSGFTKIPSGESLLCMVNEIIDTALNLIRYDKKAKGISILKEFSSDLPEIVTDANQLSQVFVNLTLNAIDAMPDGGTLTVRSFTRDGSVAIQFQDTGIGIPKKDINKIFDPFYTTKEKGTGLGLAVSYDIIKKMNGTLTVSSVAGKSTTFTILLPVEHTLSLKRKSCIFPQQTNTAGCFDHC
ncbi:MAG: ATP-binding protein [Dissulfurispiraceae bacterium]